MERWVEIGAEAGTFKAFVAEPQAPFKAAVVVIQEIFGVNDVVKGKARWLAGQGFLAIAPDLFWRLQPGVELSDRSEGEWAQAMALMGKFNAETGVADIERTIAYARERESAAKVGAVGYCLGGLLAYLTACRTDADAAVGYYGVSIDQHLSEAEMLDTPLMLHIAGKDGFVPPTAQEAMHRGLGSHANVTLYDYPEQDHAFTREGGKNFDMHAAELADARTLAFFRQHLV